MKMNNFMIVVPGVYSPPTSGEENDDDRGLNNRSVIRTSHVEARGQRSEDDDGARQPEEEEMEDEDGDESLSKSQDGEFEFCTLVKRFCLLCRVLH